MFKLAIGESRSKNFKAFSRATELIEGVGHSHIFVSYKDHLGLRWVAEARGSGIRIISNVEFKQTNEVVNIYHYETNLMPVVIRYIWDESPKKYGYMQIGGLLYMRVGNYLARAVGLDNRFANPFRDGDHSQICCEFGLNCATIAMGVDRLTNVENYGLIETRRFNRQHGERAPQAMIDRINGVS